MKKINKHIITLVIHLVNKCYTIQTVKPFLPCKIIIFLFFANRPEFVEVIEPRYENELYKTVSFTLM